MHSVCHTGALPVALYPQPPLTTQSGSTVMALSERVQVTIKMLALTRLTIALLLSSVKTVYSSTQ